MHEALERLAGQERVGPSAVAVDELLRRAHEERRRWWRRQGSERGGAGRAKQMIEAVGGACAAEAEQVLMVGVRVPAEGGCEVGADLREAERHVGRAGGAVEVAGGEAGRREAGGLLREGVAESPVGDEAVPPAWMEYGYMQSRVHACE